MKEELRGTMRAHAGVLSLFLKFCFEAILLGRGVREGVTHEIMSDLEDKRKFDKQRTELVLG